MQNTFTYANQPLLHACIVVLFATLPVFAADLNLIWSEEFNTDGPVDTSRWYFETGTGSNGWGNNELEYYTNRPENAYIRNGNLEITVRRQDTAGRRFTSARMTTGYGRFSFQYGKVEARMKVIKGKGMWPAFWMMGESIAQTSWPGCGEIDIMEVMNRGGPFDDNIVLSTAHWLNDANNSHASYGLSDTSSAPLADSFHVYGITWDLRYIRAFFDGKQFWEIDITPSGLSEFHQPFYLLLNAAVGGSPLGISNPDDVTAILPQIMMVDYIRVYQEGTPVTLQNHERNRKKKITVYVDQGGSGLWVDGVHSGIGMSRQISIYTLDGKVLSQKSFSNGENRMLMPLPGNISYCGLFLVKVQSGAETAQALFCR